MRLPENKFRLTIGVLLLLCLPVFPLIAGFRTVALPPQYICWATVSVAGSEGARMKAALSKIERAGAKSARLSISYVGALGASPSSTTSVSFGAYGATPEEAAQSANGFATRLQEALSLGEPGASASIERAKAEEAEPAKNVLIAIVVKLIEGGILAVIGLLLLFTGRRGSAQPKQLD
jgi:hypothetical protein